MATKKDDEKFIKQAYSKVIDIMSKEFRINKSDFPKIKIVEGDSRAYDHENNTIILGREKTVHAVEILSEEVGHFIRSKIRGASENGTYIEELNPKEFGFRSSLMIYEKINQNEKEKYFPHGRPSLLKHEEMKKKMRKATENTLGIIILAGLIIALFLLTGNLTGYLIAEYKIQSVYGFVLLIFLFILGAVWIWLRRQNSEESKYLEKQISSIAEEGYKGKAHQKTVGCLIW